jgi:hypothetical protein
MKEKKIQGMSPEGKLTISFAKRGRSTKGYRLG